MRGLRQERGVALVTALLIVAVAAIAGASVLASQNVAIHRSGALRLAEQAWWYGAGVENWVGEILRQDRQQNEIDHLGEPWAQPVENLPIEGGSIRGRVFDQQGCFNLNNLAGDRAESNAAQFLRLLGLLEQADGFAAPALVQAVQDWIDPDADARAPGGAEDGVYTSLDPPYRAANQPMRSPSELLLVQGMSRELYLALRPHVCTLPAGTAINVNTASALVLASLAPQMTVADGEALVAMREKDPFDTVQEFMQAEPLAGRQVDQAGLAVASQYFLLAGEVNVGTGRVNLYSLFFRDQGGNPRLLTHSKDAY